MSWSSAIGREISSEITNLYERPHGSDRNAPISSLRSTTLQPGMAGKVTIYRWQESEMRVIRKLRFVIALFALSMLIATSGCATTMDGFFDKLSSPPPGAGSFGGC